MPRKIRELITQLVKAGFIDRGGKSSHRNFVHPNVQKLVTVSGNAGDDVKHYQEKAIKLAIKELEDE
jgi:predicted RNA binding protein YcfA (HicA-like mRNA interferase family)